MLRYKNLGNSVISVNLNNGYSVVAISIWDRGDNVYRTTLYLKGDTYDTLELIEGKEGMVVKADMKTIKGELTKIITNLLKDGFFKHYIERYVYILESREHMLEVVLSELNEIKEKFGVLLYSPVQCPIYKIKDKYRMRILIKCLYDDRMHKLLNDMLEKFEKEGKKLSSKVIIQVNPNNMS